MRFRSIVILCLLLSAFTLPLTSAAQDESCNLVTLLDGWARPSPAGAPNGAAFGLLVNLSDQADTLVSASSDVAEAVELHEMVVAADDVMQMRPVESGMRVEAGGYLELRPGGLHIMFINLKQPLVAGETIDLTLHFQGAGDVAVSIPVREMVDMDNPMGEGMAQPDMTPEAIASLSEWPESCAGVHFLGAWARSAAAGMPNSAAYGLLVNLTESDTVLVSTSSTVSEVSELHEMTMGEGDVMQMRLIEGGIVIPAGGTAVLQPGGKHIMLIGLTQELVVGETFQLNLTFEGGGEVVLEIPVREGAETSMSMGGMGS
jgi:copper(I)-binding protein